MVSRGKAVWWRWFLWFSMGVWAVGLVLNFFEGDWWYVITDASLIVLGALRLWNLDYRCVDCKRSRAEVMDLWAASGTGGK